MAAASLEIVPWNPDWSRQFEAEARRIRGVLGELALRVDHVGSTSVPGLAAKPVIDINVSVEELVPFDSWRGPLAELGYRHVPHPDDERCPFLHRPENWPHSHHIHMVRAGDPEELRCLAFVARLRNESGTRAEYEKLKRELAQRFDAGSPESRNAYANAKGEFIERVIAAALEAGYALPSASSS